MITHCLGLKFFKKLLQHQNFITICSILKLSVKYWRVEQLPILLKMCNLCCHLILGLDYTLFLVSLASVILFYQHFFSIFYVVISLSGLDDSFAFTLVINIYFSYLFSVGVH